MSLRAAVLLSASVALLPGCTGVPVRIDNAVPPNVDRSAARVVEADAWGFQFFLLIPVAMNSRYARAWEGILAQADGGYVTNVQVKEGWRYGFIGTFYHATFRATVYPRTLLPEASAPGR